MAMKTEVENGFGIYKKVTWDLSPLRRRYLEEKYDLTKGRMANLVRYNLTSAVRTELLGTIEHEKTMDANAVGSKGSGKSTMLLKFNEEHYKVKNRMSMKDKLTSADIDDIVNRIFFIQDYLIKYIKENAKLDTTCVQLDERTYTLGDSSYANLKRITNLTETLRKRKINFFYASPKIRWNFEYEYVFEPLEINYKYKILHSAVFDKDMRLLGSLYTTKCDDQLEKAYEDVKEDFMTKVSKGELRTMEYEDMAVKVMEEYPQIIDLYKETTSYHKEIAAYSQMDSKEKRKYGKPIAPMEKLTNAKLTYYINKVNADYTQSEKSMIIEEIKAKLSKKVGR